MLGIDHVVTCSTKENTGCGICLYTVYTAQSLKFKRVSLNETPEFPFWGLNTFVDFVLRDSKKMETINKLNYIIFHNKNIYFHKTP